MHRLSSIILLVCWGISSLFAQSPHGENLSIDCAQCHNADGWEIDYTDLKFDHSTTNFDLEGAHTQTDCKLCHTSMVFDEAPMECLSCHADVHSMSVGNDCMRCHNSESWLVDIIPELHEENGFPLIGAHSSLSCVECHASETNLRFDRLGNECIECHRDDFIATQNPDHQAAGYSTDCVECHNSLGFDWGSDGINHSFFPLTLGHDIQDCFQCHTQGNYSDISPECVSCHLTDYNQTTNPNHLAINLSNDCVSCHTTDPNWMPATFLVHDAQFFPIYSGEHKDEWDSCTDCHQNTSNYADFTCLTCHKKGDTDGEHEDEPDYVYESNACLECHPDGSE